MELEIIETTELDLIADPTEIAMAAMEIEFIEEVELTELPAEELPAAA